MNTLQEALNQVKEALKDGVSPEKAIGEAADDYRLRPEFIERKFKESNQCSSLQSWLDQQKELAERAKETALKSRQVAVEKAIAIATQKWRVTGVNLEVAGRIFSIGRHEYAFVVYGADSAQYAIRAIDLVTHRIVNFPAHKFDEIRRQIAPEMAVAA